MAEPTEKKIIIDDDWKEEAQREKEALAAAMEQEKQKAKHVMREKASFPMLLSGLATQALVCLGELENPFTKQRETDLPEAQFHIDMLEILQAKTKGNLSPDEARMMEGLLFDLRMRFVQKSQTAKA
jgi:hypothetical protein